MTTDTDLFPPTLDALKEAGDHAWNGFDEASGGYGRALRDKSDALMAYVRDQTPKNWDGYCRTLEGCARAERLILRTREEWLRAIDALTAARERDRLNRDVRQTRRPSLAVRRLRRSTFVKDLPSPSNPGTPEAGEKRPRPRLVVSPPRDGLIPQTPVRPGRAF